MPPELLQVVAVPHGIHRRPEAAVAVAGELPLRCKAAERLLLENGPIVLEVAAYLWREDEKPAVHPSPVSARLLLKGADKVPSQLHRAVAAPRLNGRHGCHPALLAVETKEGGKVDVGHTVAVGEAELLIAQVRQHPPQPPARSRLLTGVDHGYPPPLAAVAVNLDGAGRQIEGHVACVEVVVGEVLLDHVALVAGADDEVGDPLGGVDLHDVPEDRPPADLYHRLRSQGGLLGKSGAGAAGKDHSLHGGEGSGQTAILQIAVVMQAGREEHTFAILGAGFSGIGAAIKLARSGRDDLVIIERAEDVGGTWRDNRYPGCACDVPSHLYSLSFAPTASWTRQYAPQPEIYRYLRGLVEREGLLGKIRFRCPLEEARYLEDEHRWQIRAGGREFLARYFIAAPGPLSDPRLPDIEGIDRFQGALFHSARWREDVPLAGRRVAVVGTGASAIQLIPKIQPIVDHLYVFQRTPGWVLPLHNGPIPPWLRGLLALFPPARTALREAVYLTLELLVLALLDRRLAKAVEWVARKHLERQVRDPQLRAALTPSFPIGCKRVLLSDTYYPALTKPNVTLVTQPIKRLEEDRIVAAGERGEEAFPVDVVIMATGFRATEIPISRQIFGKGGLNLAQFWGGSPAAYLGATVPGFPSLYFLYGPNTNLGHNSILVMVEAQINQLLSLLDYVEEQGAVGFEVSPAVYDAYNRRLQADFKGTVWEEGSCSSWYIDANGHNSSIWPHSTLAFRVRSRRFDPTAYQLIKPTPAITKQTARPALVR